MPERRRTWVEDAVGGMWSLAVEVLVLLVLAAAALAVAAAVLVVT